MRKRDGRREGMLTDILAVKVLTSLLIMTHLSKVNHL